MTKDLMAGRDKLNSKPGPVQPDKTAKQGAAEAKANQGGGPKSFEAAHAAAHSAHKQDHSQGQKTGCSE